MIRQARGYVSLHQTIMVTWRLRKALPFQTAIVSMMFQRQQDNLLACNLIWLHRWSLGGMEPGTDLQVQKLWKHLPWGSLEESVKVNPKTLGQAGPPRELANPWFVRLQAVTQTSPAWRLICNSEQIVTCFLVQKRAPYWHCGWSISSGTLGLQLQLDLTRVVCIDLPLWGTLHFVIRNIYNAMANWWIVFAKRNLYSIYYGSEGVVANLLLRRSQNKYLNFVLSLRHLF